MVKGDTIESTVWYLFDQQDVNGAQQLVHLILWTYLIESEVIHASIPPTIDWLEDKQGGPDGETSWLVQWTHTTGSPPSQLHYDSDFEQPTWLQNFKGAGPNPSLNNAF